MTENYSHTPVMLDEVINVLSPKDDNTYIDCTFGTGGYSQAILQKAKCSLHAIDRDDNAFYYAKKLKERFPDNFTFHHSKFSNLSQIGVKNVDGIIFDIGVSSPQLDNPKRGFSFSKEGNLDMGMGLNDLSAKEIVNGFSESDLANIIYEYGEEPFSRKIAKAIVIHRKKKIIETTTELADIIHKTIGNKGKTDSATKTFQAIRICVNDELNELSSALSSGFSLLKKDGCLLVVTFHSLEDRIVKRFFNNLAGKNGSVSRYTPIMEKNIKKSIMAYEVRLIKPSEKEIAQNPRSRSAKLRYLKKV